MATAIWQKRPIYMAKGTYYMAKEAYLCDKRGIFVWQKRDLRMSSRCSSLLSIEYIMQICDIYIQYIQYMYTYIYMYTYTIYVYIYCIFVLYILYIYIVSSANLQYIYNIYIFDPIQTPPFPLPFPLKKKNRCANWRDLAHTWAPSKQEQYYASCMAQVMM